MGKTHWNLCCILQGSLYSLLASIGDSWNWTWRSPEIPLFQYVHGAHHLSYCAPIIDASPKRCYRFNGSTDSRYRMLQCVALKPYTEWRRLQCTKSIASLAVGQQSIFQQGFITGSMMHQSAVFLWEWGHWYFHPPFPVRQPAWAAAILAVSNWVLWTHSCSLFFSPWPTTVFWCCWDFHE